jgi:hypothetical protein
MRRFRRGQGSWLCLLCVVKGEPSDFGTPSPVGSRTWRDDGLFSFARQVDYLQTMLQWLKKFPGFEQEIQVRRTPPHFFAC